MKLILVGGFLGAGKTTLLSESAKRLAQRGFTVGLITNDQVPELVDTAILSRSGAAVREVAGSCFCCNFEGFHDAVQSLRGSGADCVIAEPVGSCTDLSATIIQPLKSRFPNYSVAPLTVLADPERVRAVLKEKNSLLHADAAYILHLQLEEADCIVLNKCDTLTDEERDELATFLTAEFRPARVLTISARTGDGIDAWLDDALAGTVSGTTIAEVDYDRYASGEAVLGWLNAVVSLRWTGGLEADWARFVTDLLAALGREFREQACEIGHVKMLLESGDGRVMANLTGCGEAAQIRIEGAPGRLNAALTVNARVQIAPDRIEMLFRLALKRSCYARAAPSITAFHCVSPGRPVPTYRYNSVVA